MNSKNKIKLISDILERYDDSVCLYYGATLNDDLDSDDFDNGYHEDWCPDCCEIIDLDDDWEDITLRAIDKVIQDKKFEP